MPHKVAMTYLYLRFVGDRSIDEKNFGIVQKGRVKELKMWSNEVSRLKDCAKFAIVAANNHHAGFGPAMQTPLER